MKANNDKKLAVAAGSDSAPNASSSGSKEAFKKSLTLKLEKLNRSGSKLTEPRPASGKGI
ncbi:MAG TPA: hypothetical protein VFQ47_08720 [Nitrososphaera sp.]|jgi:hypothetical protein|nr:hypothetical protein [Nitrososphaera sp.]